MHKASFIIHQSLFEGKDCSFLVVIVCEASVVVVFSNIILTALLCKDFKGFNRDSLAESQRVVA